MTDRLRIDPTPDGAILAVRAIPRSGRSQVAGIRGGALLVRLAAAPVEGAANAALMTLLADVLKIPKSHLAVVGGEKTRDKRVRVTGLDAGALAARLAICLEGIGARR